MACPGKQFKGGPEDIPQLDWARLAAFIDGEGSIYIHRGSSRRGRLIVCVCNTSPRLMCWLERFGVGNTHAQRRTRLSTRTYYQWRVISRQAAWILERCLPYFVIKRDEAELGLAYQAMKKYRGPHKSDAEAKAERDVAEQLHQLKEPRPLEMVQ